MENNNGNIQSNAERDLEINTLSEKKDTLASPSTQETNPRYKGIGGWLILVIIGLSCSIIRLIYVLISTYYPIFTNGTLQTLSTPGTKYYSAMWFPLITFEGIFNCLFVLYAMYILLFLFMKKRYIPKLMIILYSVNLIFVIIDHLLAIQLPAITQAVQTSSSQIVSAVVACSIWIPYFLKSERVKNTFVK